MPVRLDVSTTRTLSDHELIVGLCDKNDFAYAEFVERFRPTLEAYARKAKIPIWEWDTCIGEVIADEAMRFANSSNEPPRNVAAYLIKAVYNRYLRIKRSADCRDRYHSAAATLDSSERVIPSLCSEAALRHSAGPDASGDAASVALRQLAQELGRDLSEEDRALLAWVGQGVSHREIAEWVGTTYEATTKRIWRLCRRLRADAKRRAEHYEPNERSEIERFLRRAG